MAAFQNDANLALSIPKNNITHLRGIGQLRHPQHSRISGLCNHLLPIRVSGKESVALLNAPAAQTGDAKPRGIVANNWAMKGGGLRLFPCIATLAAKWLESIPYAAALARLPDVPALPNGTIVNESALPVR